MQSMRPLSSWLSSSQRSLQRWTQWQTNRCTATLRAARDNDRVRTHRRLLRTIEAAHHRAAIDYDGRIYGDGGTRSSSASAALLDALGGSARGGVGGRIQLRLG